MFESGGDRCHAAKLDRWMAIILKAAALREESVTPGAARLTTVCRHATGTYSPGLYGESRRRLYLGANAIWTGS